MDRQIYYKTRERIHLCESSKVAPADLLVWTKCGIDVPANQGYRLKTPSRTHATCSQCLASHQEQPK